MCDLIDYITDTINDEEIDPNVLSEWLENSLAEPGPWAGYEDQRSQLASLFAYKLIQSGHCNTHYIRQRLLSETNISKWVRVVNDCVIPILKEDILDEY